MYVCLCFGLTDRDIRAVIDTGADTVDKIAAACAAGTDCGTCRQVIVRLLADRDREDDEVEADGQSRFRDA